MPLTQKLHTSNPGKYNLITTMLNKQAGILTMVATAFLWSLAGLFIKAVDWNPITIAGSRSLIASIVIVLFLRTPRITWSAPQITAAIANSATMLLFPYCLHLPSDAGSDLEINRGSRGTGNCADWYCGDSLFNCD
ncbi:MAG: DMT family transporter [Chitinispirillaceae bacterium]|nr:DMT family transporter [Chitinispirillaceae bacterium]